MSKFTQNEETEIVKSARDITATIEYEEREVKRLKSESFSEPPEPPVRKILEKAKKVEPEYPEKPKTTYKYSEYFKEKVMKYSLPARILRGIVLVLLALSGIGYLIILVLFGFSYKNYIQKKKEMNNQLANSKEYLQAVENAEKTAQKKQKELEEKIRLEQEKIDKEYATQKQQYESVILPQYNDALNLWNANQERKIAIIEEEIRLNKEALDELYANTKIVSLTYRALWILSWLYNDMSTSDHDIRYATELLDRDRQRLATQEAGNIVRKSVGQVEQTMKVGFNAVYNAIEDGNELQLDTINNLSKMRRNMNTGNVIGTVQRHNTNKMLEQMVKKKR
ncbi:hypothetical protein [uncultured Eubacterium sp.]|uniref:hypothetical protein n=1 Tax=uncultured Eubacterium sp. TaxID=165185 RepID=UPI003263321B